MEATSDHNGIGALGHGPRDILQVFLRYLFFIFSSFEPSGPFALIINALNFLISFVNVFILAAVFELQLSVGISMKGANLEVQRDLLAFSIVFDLNVHLNTVDKHKDERKL